MDGRGTSGWSTAAVHLLPQGDTPDIPPALKVSGLTVVYDRKPALWDISYRSPTEGLVAIVGPNGAGKSTFLKAVLGLVPRVSGKVELLGEPAGKVRGRIGYVPQRTAVDWSFPTTALDVVAMGLYGRIGWLRPVRRHHLARARRYLADVGMEAFADRQIGQLSGGQQQRVFLARALAQEASVYFMDEPLVGVDAATESVIFDILRRLRRDGRTVFCVHHDLQSVSRHFDHVLILNMRSFAAGPVDRVFTAENLQEAYGGRLAPGELSGLRLSG